MTTAQELFEDARTMGQEDALDNRRKGKRELGKVYGDFDVSNQDFEWIVVNYRKGYDETAVG